MKNMTKAKSMFILLLQTACLTKSKKICQTCIQTRSWTLCTLWTLWNMDTINTMDTISSNQDSTLRGECIPQGKINHLHGISLSNSDLLTYSQLVRAVNISSLDEVPFSYWNADIDWEKESDQEAEALESQSQDQDSHSIPSAQYTPPMDVLMVEDERSLSHSRES